MARPSPPPGYHVCPKAPATPVMKTGGPYQHSDANWKYSTYEDTSGQGLTFYDMFSLSLSDQYWLYPSSVDCGAKIAPGTSGKKTKIREMQQALNVNGYGLKVDGVIGPSTCAAAYDYQQTVVGDTHHQLTGDFFVSLGLPSNYAVVLGHECVPWWQGELPPWIPEPSVEIKPKPQPQPTPEPEPEPVAAAPTSNKKLLVTIIGAAGGAVLGLAIRSQWYPRTQAWAAAGAGGAAGLLGGLIIGATALRDSGNAMTVARLGKTGRFPMMRTKARRRLGLIQAEKKKQPPIGLGYIPPMLESAWDRRGAVGFHTPEGIRKFW